MTLDFGLDCCLGLEAGALLVVLDSASTLDDAPERHEIG